MYKQNEKKDVKKEYIKAQARADDLAMKIMHRLNCIEIDRNPDEDNWDCIGTMNSICNKLETVLAEIETYQQIRCEESDD